MSIRGWAQTKMTRTAKTRPRATTTVCCAPLWCPSKRRRGRVRIGGRPKLTTAARWGAGWDFAWPCVGVCEVGCDTRESVRHVRERVCDVCETESGFAALRAMCECLAALQNVRACSAKRQKRCVECAYTHTHTHTHTHTAEQEEVRHHQQERGHHFAAPPLGSRHRRHGAAPRPAQD